MKFLKAALLCAIFLAPSFASAAVVLTASQFAAGTSFTSPTTVSVPTNVAGSVIVILYGDSSNLGTIGWPSGFTSVATIPVASSPWQYGIQLTMAWKVSAGSEGSTYSISNTNASHPVVAVFSFSGAAATQFVTSGTDYSSIAGNGGASPTTTTAPAIVCGVGDALVYGSIGAFGATDTNTYTYPTVTQGVLTLVNAIQQGTSNALRVSALTGVSSGGSTGTASMVSTGTATNFSAFFFHIKAATAVNTSGFFFSSLPRRHADYRIRRPRPRWQFNGMSAAVTMLQNRWRSTASLARGRPHQTRRQRCPSTHPPSATRSTVITYSTHAATAA